MKTIKVIDLLNKIAEGEEVPKKIKFNGNIYEYRGYMYCTEKANYQDLNDYLFGHWNFLILNDEVEILEEEKKIPEKINVKGSYNSNKGFEDFNDNEKILVDKINDLLDYLESKEKGE